MTGSEPPLPHPGHPPDDAVGTVDDDETLHEQREVAGLTQAQIVRRRFFRHKGAMISLFVLAIVVVLAATSIGWGPIPGWYDWPWDQRVPSTQDTSPTLSIIPTWLGGDGIHLGVHPFGLDNQAGRDIFAVTMRGIQTSLIVVAVVGVVSTLVGVVVGAVAGYFGGWLDAILMRATDAVIIIPILVMVAVLGFSLHGAELPLIGVQLDTRGPFPIAILMALFVWTGLARLVRAEFLALREREFVDAARVAGASPFRIIFKHVLPNTVGVIVVNGTIAMGNAILLEAALAFVGFGILPPEVSLGQLAVFYQGRFSSEPALFLWPCMFIVTIVLCIQFVGDGLRDAFDPRQKRVPKRKELSSHDNAMAQSADDGAVQA